MPNLLTKPFETGTLMPRRVLDYFFEGMPNFPIDQFTVFEPPMDVYEKDGTYYVEAALPGYKKDDVEIEVSGNLLSIYGKYAKEQNGGYFHHHEIRRGKFSRTITFPQDVDASTVKAAFEGGMLKLEVGFSTPLAAKKIAIRG